MSANDYFNPVWDITYTEVYEGCYEWIDGEIVDYRQKHIFKLLKEFGDFKDWMYAGGNMGRHERYFVLKFGYGECHPDPIDKCPCGIKILEQCYIQNIHTKEIRIIGNHCIKKFLGKVERKCEECKKPHKNRKVNRCNDCRSIKKVKCADCGKTKKVNTKTHPVYKRCYNCNNRWKLLRQLED